VENPKRLVLVMGTRPEAIKLAPVVKALRARPEAFQPLVVATAQHRRMLDQVLGFFRLTPEVDLRLMRPDQDLAGLTARVLKKMQAALKELKPHLVLVQGDTTTAFATALAAFYLKVPVAHVEAGLRSHSRDNPFPEEANRQLTAVLTDLHLAPTPLARRQLLREGVPAERIAVTGNTVVDAVNFVLEVPWSPRGTPAARVPLKGRRLILVTSHRRESWGPELEEICLALRDLASRFEDLTVVYPVHLNPNVRRTVYDLLSGVQGVHLLPPLNYLAFINLMRRAYLVLTDSGGVIEEAATLRKPLLIMRRVTERPEAVAAGVARLVGTSRQAVAGEATRLLTDARAYQAMTAGANPFGDGRAAPRIVEALGRWFGHQTPLLPPAQEFRPPRGKPARNL